MGSTDPTFKSGKLGNNPDTSFDIGLVPNIIQGRNCIVILLSESNV